MKTYVLTVSTNFPVTHKRKGEPTGFIESIGRQIKLHTIRGNYLLWKKRIDEVNDAIALLSVRNWTGKPYKSKQNIICEFHKGSIGIQDLYFDCQILSESFISHETAEDGIQAYVSNQILAENDGLSLEDFQEWFKKYDLSEPMAIIHFTDFRY